MNICGKDILVGENRKGKVFEVGLDLVCLYNIMGINMSGVLWVRGKVSRKVVYIDC